MVPQLPGCPKPTFVEEVPDATKAECGGVHTSNGKPYWSWEPVSARSVVSGVPHEMESGNYQWKGGASKFDGNPKEAIIDDKFNSNDGKSPAISAEDEWVVGKRDGKSISMERIANNGDEMPMWKTSREIESEEGRRDPRTALLQVPPKDLRILCLGPDGASCSEDADSTRRATQSSSGDQSRGDKDPDVLSLERYAPTVTTSIIAVALQVASSMKFRCALGDLKNAFMQSDPLRREQGRLFCKQPAGGLPSLQAGQIIEILAGAYGLGDAPAHWRKSLKKVLLELGYEQSAMDPCSFRLFRGQELCGLVIVEVDDILSLGNQHHYEKMEILQRRFKFGKFKYLDEQPNGASFNGRRLRMAQDGTYLIDMQKFIEERLNEVPLEVGRAKMKEEEATEDEKKLTRAAIGALTWSAKEGRPDAAAAASLIASSLNTLRVQDILDLNKTIKEMKKSADLCLKIQPIEPSRMVWGVVTDASYANAKDKASQGAYGVICCDEDVLEGRKGVTNLIHWKSGKMHRIVNSTLAAESQSLSKGLSELAWTVTVYQEMITHNFDLKEWQTKVKQQRMVALAKTDSDSRLKRCLCVVDAKSLYDHLVKETVGTAEDRRTAIEMQVIRQAMGETGACIRWVPHPKMFMDCLTKRFGNRASLYDLLQSGKFSVCDNEVNNN